MRAVGRRTSIALVDGSLLGEGRDRMERKEADVDWIRFGGANGWMSVAYRWDVFNYTG